MRILAYEQGSTATLDNNGTYYDGGVYKQLLCRTAIFNRRQRILKSRLELVRSNSGNVDLCEKLVEHQ
jgi:hypothetical protein